MRINKVFCDKCKKEIKRTNFQRGIDIISQENHIIQMTFNQQIELCKECSKRFWSWLKCK